MLGGFSSGKNRIQTTEFESVRSEKCKNQHRVFRTTGLTQWHVVHPPTFVLNKKSKFLETDFTILVYTGIWSLVISWGVRRHSDVSYITVTLFFCYNFTHAYCWSRLFSTSSCLLISVSSFNFFTSLFISSKWESFALCERSTYISIYLFSSSIRRSLNLKKIF